MPKVKHGRRHNHYRVKNCERSSTKKVLQDITNVGVQAELPTETAYIPMAQSDRDFFDEVQSSKVLVLENWHVFRSPECIEFSLLQNLPPKPSVVKFTLTLYKNLHWVVRLYGRLLTCQSFLAKFPVTISSFEELETTCNSLSTLNVCLGNNDESFVKLLDQRGGVIMSSTAKSVVAFLDINSHSKTVRHIKCSLICADGELRCSSCLQYRPTLRAMRSRSGKTVQSAISNTDSSSHTNYRYLGSEELKKRMTNVQNEKRAAERKLKKLKGKLLSVIEEEGVELHEDDCDDLTEIFEQADKDTTKLTREHFQRIFWEQQRDYNKLKNKRRIRWHPLMIRFALNLKYLSTSAYRALGNFIALPSQRTLCDYTHVMKVNSGVCYPMIDRLKEDMDFKASTTAQKMIGIMLDEMKVKSGLVFNKQSGKLVGFINLGTLNSDLEAMETFLNNDTSMTSQPPELAGSMLVLMTRRILKPSSTFPVAQYPTSSLSGEKLYPIVWDTIEIMELNEFQVFYVTCDGLSANRKLFRISQDVDDTLSFPYKTKNPYSPERYLYFFCDAPHLLKTARNCFSNSFAHSHSRMLKV